MWRAVTLRAAEVRALTEDLPAPTGGLVTPHTRHLRREKMRGRIAGVLLFLLIGLVATVRERYIPYGGGGA